MDTYRRRDCDASSVRPLAWLSRTGRSGDRPLRMCANVLTFPCGRWDHRRSGLPPTDRKVNIMKFTMDGALARHAAPVPRNLSGALNRTARGMLLSLIVAGGVASGPALARSVVIKIAPPPARVEIVPVQHHGYTWAPGYWGWQRTQYVWVKGHPMRTRSGYTWAPDRWNQVDNRHEFQPGHWTRGSELHAQ